MLKAVFMGSPEFAVASLEVAHQACNLVGVYTQPDKPRGRGNQVTPTPVKARALELGLPVYEPQKIRDAQVIEQLQAWAPDVILVVAYAKLIPSTILELPRLGCVNVHPSLLPKFRGAIPVQASIMAGETETGVCTFFMDEGYDTGDVIHFHTTPLGGDETGQQLLSRLSLVGAEVLKETIQLLETGQFTRTPQPKEAVGGYSKQLKKEDLSIRWDSSSLEVSNFVRALAHEPAAATTLWRRADDPSPIGMKISKASPFGDSPETQVPAGTVLSLEKNRGFVVSASQGAVLVEEVKPAGKGWMSAWSFALGGAVQVGSQFK